MYLLGVAVAAWMSFGMPYVLGVPEQWIMSQDVWTTTNAAQYAWNGGAGFVFSANPWFAALPGFIYLYAPVVALGGHFGLVTSYPIPLYKPSMWLVSGPFFFLCGATAVLGVDYLAETLQVNSTRRKLITAAVAVAVVGPTPGFEGHPEDMLALALVCFSFALGFRGHFAGAALALGFGVLMQTWAGLAIPVLVAASPTGLRLRTLFRTAAAPAVLGVSLLAVDFHRAAMDLLRQPMPDTGQHLPWWGLAPKFVVSTIYGNQHMVAGSTTRSLAVVVAVAAGWSVRNRRDPSSVAVALSLAMFARVFFEVEVWPYYFAPAAVLVVVVGALRTQGETKRFATLCAGACLLYLSSAGGLLSGTLPSWLEMAVVASTGALCFLSLTARGDVAKKWRVVQSGLLGRGAQSEMVHAG
jgi:hypothetical protein